MKQLLFSMLTLLCCTVTWAQSSDVLSGEFSINASGTTVQFSKGNLQYVNGNWQFAEHQYDYIGNNQSDNNKDLFAFNGYSTPDASWFNMSHAQWKYLLATRSVTNSLSTGARYTMATLGGAYKGLIIFPDDYTHPDGTDFVAGTYNGRSDFTATVSLEGWALMEAAGCVFLPAAGYYSYGRKEFGGFGEAVDINTTTSYNDDNFYTPVFKSDNLNYDDKSYKQSLIPVRLAQLKTNLQKDADDYYLIGTVQDWKNFAAIVNNEINTAANARMIADIDLGDDQTYISPTWHGEFSSQHYHGTFDGQGHTLTVHYNSSNMFHTPFSQTSGATIKNLHVAGTIKSTSSDPSHMSGLVSNSAGSDVIQNIWVSADITGGSNSWIECGAFVGCNNCGNTTITDCLFTGSITTTGGNNGCFAGYNQGYQNSTITTNNCLSTGTFNFTSGGVSVGTINNSYVKSYPNSIPAAMRLTDEELADGTVAYRLQAGRTDMFWGQRIGTDTEPVLTNDESYRVYRSINGGYTNDPTLAYEGLQQDVNDNYLLGCVWDWKEFAEIVNSGTNNTANAKMTADIDLGSDQTKIGSSSTNYSGIFDGQGHTLTVNWTTTGNYCAPFPYINGATFKNLHVTGTINTSHRFTGGLVGKSLGTSYVNNCRSSVEMISSYSGDAVRGGFAASVEGVALNFNDCIFDGTFTGPSSQTWGGFVGWKYSGSVNIQNGLFVPKSVNVSATYSATFSGNSGTVTNSYYTVQINNSTQGTKATAEQLADGTITYKLQNNRGDLVWGQRIGTDTEPVMTNDESYRVYRSINGGYTNDPTLAYEGLQQDADDNYLLGCVWAWQDFAALVNGGTTNINARMTADIDLGDDQTMIGSYHQRYQGTFNGQGHTLTVNYNTSGMSCETEQRDLNFDFLGAGPFKDIQGATIRNLHTAGKITADKIGAAGLVGWTYGTNTIEQCWSDVDIVSSNNTADTFAGFVAFQYGTQLSITDCVYTGKIQSESKISHGGFVAFQKVGVTNLNNCLLILDEGSDVNTTALAGYIFHTFVRNYEKHNVTNTINNCYYLTPFGVEQGTQATAAELADGTITYKLQNNREEEVWVQDVLTNQPQLAIFANKYTVPSSGIGTFSAKAKFAVPEGLTAHYCKTYNSEARTISVANIDGAVPANTGVLLRGTPGETYTLTGTNSEAATVTDNALVAVTEETSIAQESGDYVNFGLSGGEFKKVNAKGGTVKANRAYLHILKSSLPTEAKSIALAWDGETTGIANLNVDANDNFDANAPMYNLAGQRVGKSYKGIVVVNGKKVLIK